MKLKKVKCAKCGRIVSRSEDSFNKIARILEIDPQDLEKVYLCKDCRQYACIGWLDISKVVNLEDDNFIEKYKNRLRWYHISRYRELAPTFIIKHIDKISDHIFKNPIFETLPDTVKLLLRTKFGR